MSLRRYKSCKKKTQGREGQAGRTTNVKVLMRERAQQTGRQEQGGAQENEFQRQGGGCKAW